MLGVFLYIFETKKEFLVCFSLSLLYLTYYLVEVVKVISIGGACRFSEWSAGFMSRCVFQKPVLHCRAGEFRALLEARVPLLREAYWPTPWCVESRLQTVLGSVLRSRLLPPVHYRRYKPRTLRDTVPSRGRVPIEPG